MKIHKAQRISMEYSLMFDVIAMRSKTIKQHSMYRHSFYTLTSNFLLKVNLAKMITQAENNEVDPTKYY